jgi:tRNA pseudouridine13 synthase
MSAKCLYPYGKPDVSGLLKSSPEDFIVTENLGFKPCGEGEHLFLWIEKSMMTTHDLIDWVAKDFSIKSRDIGHSGLKDKIALTRQWLSLYLPGMMNQLQLPAVSEYKILGHAWHNKKLRPGTHRSNHFEVFIRNVAAVPEVCWQQLEMIRRQGMANYFGRQRFGMRGDNFERALQAFSSPGRARKLSRNKRSLYISALRSSLFNSILSHRIEQGHWESPIEGDVFMLNGSHSIFYEPINDRLLERFTQRDLSSTISLYGSGNRLLQNEALELEDLVFARNESVLHCLIEQKAKLQMRATRVSVDGLQVQHDSLDESLRIEVTLPRGSYFTTLLEHFVDVENV